MKTNASNEAALAYAFTQIEQSLSGTGWDAHHVAEARQIVGLLNGTINPAGVSTVVKSKAEILREDRYFQYWYFEGAPLSVQIAFEAGLVAGAFIPDVDQIEKCTQFQEFFKSQLAFKRALNWSESVGGWLFPGEAENIWKAVRERAGTAHGICEIGSWAGRSTIVLGAARELYCPGKPLHVIDDWQFGGQPELYPYLSDARALRLEFEENTRGYLKDSVIHESTFQDFAASTSNLPGKFDLVFHDAGHTAQDFERDLPLLERLLAPQATLLIHDYVSHNFGEARQVIDNWIHADPTRKLELTLGSTAVIRIGALG